jgi:fructose-1,6-bisphosphatase/inositol monophosphatase family enzyme
MADSRSLTRLPEPPEYFVTHLRELHERIRERLVTQLRRESVEALSQVTDPRGGDTIYGIDERGEEVLFQYCDAWGQKIPFVLIAEGIRGSGERVFPDDASEAQAAFRLIVDPIDGTRAIMYDKRSAWILSGVAPNRGPATRLDEIEVAMQTEVPTTKQTLSDSYWAWRGGGAHGRRTDLISGTSQPVTPRPSKAETVAHGFATISKFFPGGKALTAALEERLLETVLGPPTDGNPLVFDDQYLASGGQLYELMVGHDRFNADLRPLTLAAADPDGRIARLCARPYDLCAELIAREAGVIVTDDRGEPLHAPLDLQSDVAWIGYANAAIRRQLEPTLMSLIDEVRRSGVQAFRSSGKAFPDA